MAIKVTLGATENTQQEKPFPKLMTCKDSVVYYFIRESYGLPIANWDEKRWETFESMTAANWDMENFTDYNEPITIQNL
jgi:hypothetical protein